VGGSCKVDLSVLTSINGHTAMARAGPRSGKFPKWRSTVSPSIPGAGKGASRAQWYGKFIIRQSQLDRSRPHQKQPLVMMVCGNDRAACSGLNHFDLPQDFGDLFLGEELGRRALPQKTGDCWHRAGHQVELRRFGRQI